MYVAVRGMSLKKKSNAILFSCVSVLKVYLLELYCVMHICFCKCFVNTPTNMAYCSNRAKGVSMNFIHRTLCCG